MDQKKKQNLTILQERLWKDTTKGELHCLLCHTFGSYADQIPESIAPVYWAPLFRGVMNKPYFPFFYWIQDKIRGMSLNQGAQILDKLKISEEHKETFLTYLYNKEAHRNEPILVVESEYQKIQWYEDLWTLFTHFMGYHPQAFYLSNIQNLPFSTLEFLLFIMENKRSTPYLFFLQSDIQKRMENEYKKKLLEELYQLVQKKDYILHIKTEASLVEKRRLQSPTSPKTTLQQAQNALATLAWKDSSHLYGALLRQIEEERVSHKEHFQKKALKGLGLALLYQRDYSGAFHQFQQLHTLNSNNRKPQELSRVYYLLGTCTFFLENYIQCQQYFHRAREEALKSEDTKSLYQAYYGLVMLESRYPSLTREEWIEYFSFTLNTSRKLGFHNSHIRLLSEIYPLESDNYYQRLREALVLAKKRKNYYRLASIYNNLAEYHIKKEEYTKVRRCYNISISLIKKFRIRNALSNIYNGFGYFQMTRGEYLEAMRLFDQALAILQEVRSFEEIATTLLNMGRTLLLAGNPKEAAVFFSHCESIMNAFNLKRLRYQSKPGVLAYLAVCYLKTNHINRAWRVFTEAQGQTEEAFAADQEGMFLNLFLQGAFQWHEQNWSAGEEKMLQAREFLKENQKVPPFLLPFFYRELGDFYRSSRQKNEGLRQYKKGLYYSRNQGNRYYKEIIKNSLKGRYHHLPAFLPDPKDTKLDWVITKIEKEKQDLALQHRVQELNFISILSKTLSRHKTPLQVIRQGIELFYANFPMAAVYYHEKRGENFIETLHFSTTFQGDPDTFPDLLKQLLSTKDSQIPQLYHPQEGWSIPPKWGLLSLPLIREDQIIGHILGIIQEDFINKIRGQLPVLSMGSQILNQILVKLLYFASIREITSRFEKQSRADILTQKGNYFTLVEDLEAEIARENRQHPDVRHTFSLLSVDLDGFEYYNETFGHKAGDTILIEFATLLGQHKRGMDKLYRLQGDEFMLLIPDTYKETAVSLARRIQDKLIEEKNYQTQIEDHLGEPIIIPSHRQLTCSIGITDSRDHELHPNVADLLIKEAHDKLKKAKEKGSNTIIY